MTDFFKLWPEILSSVRTPEALIALVILAFVAVGLRVTTGRPRPWFVVPVLMVLMVAAVLALTSMTVVRVPKVVSGVVSVDQRGNLQPLLQVGGFTTDLEPGSSGRYRVHFEPPMPCKPDLSLVGNGKELLLTPVRLQQGGGLFTFDVETVAGQAKPPFDVQFVAVCVYR